MTGETLEMVKQLSLGVWLGTIGKCWAANSIAEWVSQGSIEGVPLRLLDLGAGRGGQWVSMIQAVPQLEVSLWDADPTHFAHWMTDTDMIRIGKLGPKESATPNYYDFVTSFSVLEHVPDVTDHLRAMYDALKVGGVAIVVWDDGHFRPNVDLRRPLSSGALAVKESGKWGASVVLGSVVPPSHFQRPRSTREAVEAAEGLGFRMELLTLCGIAGIKNAISLLEESRRLDAMNSWLSLERSILGWKSLDAATLRKYEQPFGSRLLLMRK